MPNSTSMPESDTQSNTRTTESAWLGHLYAELHAIAERCFRSERASHTLQPTALVHEAVLRLSSYPGAADKVGQDQNTLALAAVIMRRVLVDHARRRKARRRTAPDHLTLMPLPSEDAAASRTHIDVLIFDEMLARFAKVDERASRVIELRFFGGLSVQETATLLDLSTSTVESDSRFALAWMRRDLAPHELHHHRD